MITNVQLVNVFTGEIYPAAIGVYNGYIAHVEADPDVAEAGSIPLPGKQRKSLTVRGTT